MAIGKLHNFFQASPVKPLGNVVRNSPIRMKPKPIGFEFAEIDARKILKPSSHDKYIHEPEFDSVVYISRFVETIFRLLSQYSLRLPRLKGDPGIFKVFAHYLSKLLGPLGYLANLFVWPRLRPLGYQPFAMLGCLGGTTVRTVLPLNLQVVGSIPLEPAVQKLLIGKTIKVADFCHCLRRSKLC